MPQVLETNQTQDFRRGRTENFYPEQRADDMGESSWHNNLRADLFLALDLFFSKRDDVFMTANMNIYCVEGNADEWFAPDILAAFGVPNYDRSIYKIWEEKVFPQVVIEIASDRTWKTDTSEKLKLYEQLGAEEYYIFDSENGKYISSSILAFRRKGEEFLLIPIGNNKIFSPRLGLEIVKTENNIRLFNPQTNKFLPTLEESAKELKSFELRLSAAKIEKKRLKAEIERLKASN